jgi:membrane-associated protein
VLFCETGLVLTPLPAGDSLLFAVGAIAATGALDVQTLLGLLILAVILGDSSNYWVGRALGPKVFPRRHGALPEQEAPRAHAPVLREARRQDRHPGALPADRPTFAPFVAGIGRMSYRRFLALQRRRRRPVGRLVRPRGLLLRATSPRQKELQAW